MTQTEIKKVINAEIARLQSEEEEIRNEVIKLDDEIYEKYDIVKIQYLEQQRTLARNHRADLKQASHKELNNLKRKIFNGE